MPLATHTLPNGQKVKLGKRPVRLDPRTLQLAKYIAPTAIAPPPVKEDWAKKVSQWPMMLNDNLGDCTCACAAHMIEEWTTYVGKAFTPTDKEVLKAYEAVSGYTPS